VKTHFTITFFAIVWLVLTVAACQSLPSPEVVSASQRNARSLDGYGPARVVGKLENAAINESSGIVASRTTPGFYWTHNDSGDGPYIYALDGRGGNRGTWRVKGASARDWEDIAAGPGPQAGVSYLYIGDIGDNSARRPDIVVYRVKEPTIRPSDAAATKRNAILTGDAEAIHLRYPDGPQDAEALLVHPLTGDLYIVTKVSFGNPKVFKAAAPRKATGVITLKQIAELNVPGLFGGLITGGDISPDGTRVALCDYLNGYELVLADRHAQFDEIWKRPLKSFDLGKRKQGESIAYRLDGRAVLVTSEGEHSPLNEVSRR